MSTNGIVFASQLRVVCNNQASFLRGIPQSTSLCLSLISIGRFQMTWHTSYTPRKVHHNQCWCLRWGLGNFCHIDLCGTKGMPFRGHSLYNRIISKKIRGLQKWVPIMMTIVYASIYCVDSNVRFVLNANTHMRGNQKISNEAGF